MDGTGHNSSIISTRASYCLISESELHWTFFHNQKMVSRMLISIIMFLFRLALILKLEIGTKSGNIICLYLSCLHTSLNKNNRIIAKNYVGGLDTLPRLKIEYKTRCVSFIYLFRCFTSSGLPFFTMYQ